MNEKAHSARWARIVGDSRKSEMVLVADVPSVGVVGFGSCGSARAKALQQAGEVYMLYIRPEYQDHGIGRKLLYRLFDSLVVRGMSSAVVWVLSENPSRFFYETMGGRRIAERTNRKWDSVIRETAYGWDDLAHVRDRSDARKAR
ncbi:MAG: GNAT family N-acetyltransferase [Rhodospirillales bacterium]|nr:GNAT family N-acetyltransferase [Rhodospirillales bacterium]